MNPLPRLFALALLIVLVALAVLLAAPALPGNRPVPTAPATISSQASVGAARLAAFSQRLSLPFALTALVLATALVATLALRPPRATDSRAPFHVTRTEVGALAKLAESTVAQSRELAHERDGRQRAEADALLKQQLLNRSLEEKIRLGRDLHDGIIQSLYAAGLTLESARAVARADPDEADRRLERCRESLNQGIRDVRTYIAGLTPDHVRNSTFTQALHALTEELGADRPVDFELRVDESAVPRLSAEQIAEMLQISREAISNSVRHGDASHIMVRLQPGENALCLLVQDNGRGFDPASRTRSGNGLGNMQARARQLGADLRIESQPGAGTRIVFTLPLQPG